MLWTVESQRLEVFSGFVGRTLVEHAAGVNDHNLVHKFVDTLSGLVQGDESGPLADIGHDAQGLGVVQGGAGIQTTGGVVPADNGGFGGQCFRDTNTLPLTTRHTTDELVTDKGVPGMSNTKHLEQSVNDNGDAGTVLLLGLVDLRELEGLPDGERREMLIILRVVVDFTAEMLVLFLSR